MPDRVVRPAPPAGRVPAKWRPPLGLVVAAVIGFAILLPLAAALALRVHESDFARNAGAGQAAVAAIVFGAALAAIAGVVVHRAVTRPVRTLIGRTRAIAAGDRNALVPLDRHGTAEFAELSQGLLDMAGSLARRADFIRSFAAHVSHELKSPLTSMRAAAEIMRDDLEEGQRSLTADEQARLLETIVAEAGRLELLLQKLRELARAEAVPVQGQSRLAEILPDLRASHPLVAIDSTGVPDASLPLPAEALAIVLGQLVDNASRHGARQVTIEAAAPGPGRVELRVRDDGEGIAPADRDRVFDAFFTTRRAEGGTGMGLAIARSVIDAHAGTITVGDCEDGALFVISLPAPQPASSKIWPPS